MNIRKIPNFIINFIRTHKQMWVFSYLLLYLPWWKWLENREVIRYHVIHTMLDDQIPFCEYFVVPYLLWFLYIPLVFLFFLLKDQTKKEFYRYAVMLYSGMTFFLIFSTVYPNIQLLRPQVMDHQNFFADLVQTIYSSDTSTNVFPSIHVYNSLAASIAIHRSSYFKNMKKTKIFTDLLSLSIILATVFLKQHSLVDVAGGFVMAVAMDAFVYRSAVMERVLDGHRRGHGGKRRAYVLTASR